MKRMGNPDSMSIIYIYMFIVKDATKCQLDLESI